MRSRPAFAVAILIAAGSAFAASASDGATAVPPLGLPIGCDLGHDCFIQKYVDVDPTAAIADYTCGSLTSDGHRGTDFRILPGEGADVLAAADGTVKAVRDGMPDNPFDAPWSVPDDRACGNGVVIDHGGGVESLVCHMTPGSLRVAQGDTVAAGDVLGRVGASGQAAFRHVHFQVMVDGQVVDPFTGLDQARASCGAKGEPLWRAGLKDALAHTPRTAVLAAGFSDAPVEMDAIEGGRLPQALAPGADALVGYGLVFGAQAGDRHQLTISGPGIDLSETFPQERDQAQSMRFAGRRMADGLTPGTYSMRYAIVRNGTVIDQRERTMTVR